MAYTTINKSSDYFNTKLYTGDDTSPRSLTGIGFQPDFVWLKRRNSAASHTLYDAVRTAGSTKGLASNSSAAEGLSATEGTTANYGYVNSFDSDGFSVTTGASNDNYVNNSSDTYVSWNWKAGTTSGISGGTITPSSYSFNTTAGISIIKYTGNATQGATLPHGLGAAPQMIIIKSSSNAEAWVVGHEHMNTTNPWDYYLHLHETASKGQNNNRFGNVTPTTSVFTLGNEDQVNSSSKTYIAYCFAEVKGFSNFGSYTGNGNTNGPFIYTGFKPAWVMIKRSTGTGDWYIQDNKRDVDNPVDISLSANSTNADNTQTNILNLVSNGFKIRTTGTGYNDGSQTYIYMAFAEAPLVGSNNIPATAR